MAGRILTDDGGRALDTNGDPISGAKLKAFLAGTSTAASLYTTSALSVAHANPVVANGNGYFAQMWAADDSLLDIKTYAADDTSFVTPLRSFLNVTPQGPSGAVVTSGVSSAATGAANLSAFNAAIASATAGDVIDVPPGTHTIDTSGGFSAAIVVNKRVTIRLRGDLKASYSAIEADPAYIMNVTTAGVRIEGPGRFIGDGTVNDVNTGTDDTFPGLLRIAADNCTVEGVTFVDPPKVGLMLYNCYRARVVGCQFTGGPTTYSDTSHFGIRVYSGGRHLIQDNRFYPDASNGMVVQCIFANTTNNCTIAGNHAYRPYEKFLYWYGTGNVTEGNIVVGNTGAIPGTNIVGTIGAVFRFHGSKNKLSDNYTTDCAGGASIIDGGGNEIVDNQFLGCGNSGIGVTGSAASLDYTRIEGNTVTYAALTGNLVADGIYLAPTYAGTHKQVSVDNNTVNGFSVADPIVNIPAWVAATAYGKNSIVKPTVGNSRYYTASVGGTSHATTEPSWPTTAGDTVVDGTVTWTCVNYSTGVQSEIRLVGASGQEFTKSSISGNNTGGGARAISLTYVINSTAAFNELDASSHHMIEATCTAVRWLLNACRGAGTKVPQSASATSVFVDFSYSGTATYDPASLADGAGATTTVTVTGAALGDFAEASFSLDLQGISLTAYVSAADTVSVRFQNESGGVIDLASGTIKARVQKG